MILIGIMSGTSLDGIDLACVEFSQHHGEVRFELLASHTYPHDSGLLTLLSHPFSISGEELTEVDIELGKYLGKLVVEFISAFKLPHPKAIASHGHTMYHRPEEGWTLQVGHGQYIAQESQLRTICNFRAKDVALGGQGAPLVPIGDRDLFKEYDCCINIGGIVNITKKKPALQAYDICAGNLILNHLSGKLGFPFDRNGEIASEGSVESGLLETLNQLPYHSEQPPKSLGLEWVQEHVVPVFSSADISQQDKLRTAVEHIAQQVSANLNGNALISGGGALNQFLMKRIVNHTKYSVTIPDQKIIEFKEAIVFAYLGYLFEMKKNNVLTAVTGGSRDHVGGYLFTP